jgi:hypothetical protein
MTASPLRMTTGGYWLMASITAGAFLARTGARNRKHPETANR